MEELGNSTTVDLSFVHQRIDVSVVVHANSILSAITLQNVNACFYIYASVSLW